MCGACCLWHENQERVFPDKVEATGVKVGSLFSGPFRASRGRTVDSIPNRLTIRRTQASSPNGCPVALRDGATPAPMRSGGDSRRSARMPRPAGRGSLLVPPSRVAAPRASHGARPSVWRSLALVAIDLTTARLLPGRPVLPVAHCAPHSVRPSENGHLSEPERT